MIVACIIVGIAVLLCLVTKNTSHGVKLIPWGNSAARLWFSGGMITISDPVKVVTIFKMEDNKVLLSIKHSIEEKDIIIDTSLEEATIICNKLRRYIGK